MLFCAATSSLNENITVFEQMPFRTKVLAPILISVTFAAGFPPLDSHLNDTSTFSFTYNGFKFQLTNQVTANSLKLPWLWLIEQLTEYYEQSNVTEQIFVCIHWQQIQILINQQIFELDRILINRISPYLFVNILIKCH